MDSLARTSIRLDRQTPHLRIQHVSVFVADQDRSIRFYVDQLGFELVMDVSAGTGRWVVVAPPDGTTFLALVAPTPRSPMYELIGKAGGEVVFVTEDVSTVYRQWSERGVLFDAPPRKPAWGGLFTTFTDPDGNAFALVGFDEITREIEQKRLELERKQEEERRTAHELEIARQVQSRLFPQNQPAISNLDYAGVCVQARRVGGDYYDFLERGSGRYALLVGDISGKGMAAALLMVNLQANLRSVCTSAADDPAVLLRAVNERFFANTGDSSYATLFFADYDEHSRTMRYANCGHLPGIVLRGNGGVERLDATGTVVGLFREWDCDTGRCALRPGDLLALYTDGVVEATDGGGEEYGEERLLDALRAANGATAAEIVDSVLADVQKYSTGSQADDITLLIARCRA